MALTQKQKRFAELVSLGESLAGAYREVYDCSTANPRTIAKEASRTARLPEVAKYIAELNDQTAALTVATREGLLSRLWRINTIAYEELTSETNSTPYTAFQAFVKTTEQLVKLGATPNLEQAENMLEKQLLKEHSFTIGF